MSYDALTVLDFIEFPSDEEISVFCKRYNLSQNTYKKACGGGDPHSIRQLSIAVMNEIDADEYQIGNKFQKSTFMQMLYWYSESHCFRAKVAELPEEFIILASQLLFGEKKYSAVYDAAKRNFLVSFSSLAFSAQQGRNISMLSRALNWVEKKDLNQQRRKEIKEWFTRTEWIEQENNLRSDPTMAKRSFSEAIESIRQYKRFTSPSGRLGLGIGGGGIIENLETFEKVFASCKR